MRRSRFIVTVAAVPLALGLSSCMDDGAGVRSEAVGEYASSSSSASGASASGSTAAEGSAPAGVVAEYETMAAEIAAEGGQRTSGKWRVGYIVEAAESWFETRGGKQVFRPVAGGETHHIEILPFEAATGRLVPDVPVRLEILDSSGKPVQAKRLRFLHGEFFHYAENFSVPESGDYTLRATIGVPTFSRHGERGDDPGLAEGTTVTFPGVPLERA